ncbi:acetyltransferase [Acinetobacter tjernbergiae]|uniref:PglD N-terminal domain-containing protein n=1 Tax=Acinetobacter tjernbergiae DSM 14971 = CIP 107465 TaxID=1120928 RepID=V2W9R0_9GAMM|nr:acetyltransferase [Acinetobacter tjernbergiae]ESK56749.1 hypothetical protein F990_00821 [Acinetobacter tjernbergiae DSM 14971 = CIP 107465]
MNKLIIIGAGGMGREVAWLARRCNRKIVGFLDDTIEKQNLVFNEVPVLGLVESYEKYLDCDFILGIGNPRAREKIINNVLKKVKNFATLVDPTALIGENVNLGEGVIIGAGSILTLDIKVGNHVIININTTISHDVIIKDYVTIAPNVALSGNIEVGKLVEIGTNAAVREKLHINNGAMIGMGAVVTKDISNNKIVIGNPAKNFKEY